ncbi:hypothetical protein Skr01_44380 [Sphaerisporangium krabiense]|uniref:Transcriptional regulator with XRE-family HTH domain n=1 Tax=Sphaerisporangium krabiense TaxID=763782 RepID=A0A7W8Z0Y0_9ACTN|nr:helix-turn-helix domain-containing protein [Sphaerisporangium krabiense]MBB5625138.1 transcriptional regulator with XRE-family HTH domain [Sphaerisporangium krabiense]GII64353.1 hypothetical protein Skr01_44380 [Sphaerisporangium krabiense]
MISNLGPELRRAREAKGLSMRSVAAAVGISPSLLSQVETGKTQPSVATLYALVTHLALSLDDLLGTSGSGPTAPHENEPGERRDARPDPSGGSNDVVQRAEDAPVIELENGVQWERLAGMLGGLVDPLITTYAPGGSSSVEGRLMRHPGIEYGYLIEGELTLKLDFDTYTLRAGDSLCFDSSRPHLYVNQTDRRAKGVWFVVGRRQLTYQAAEISKGLDTAGASAAEMLEAWAHNQGHHRD